MTELNRSSETTLLYLEKNIASLEMELKRLKTIACEAGFLDPSGTPRSTNMLDDRCTLFSIRVLNALRAHFEYNIAKRDTPLGIITLQDVYEYGPYAVSRILNLGVGSMVEIMEVFISNGFDVSNSPDRAGVKTAIKNRVW